MTSVVLSSSSTPSPIRVMAPTGNPLRRPCTSRILEYSSAHSGNKAQQAGEARRHVARGNGSRGEWRGGRGGGFLGDAVHHGLANGAFDGGGRRVLVAEDGTLRGALAVVAQCLATGAAIGDGGRFRMVEAVHNGF